MVSCNCRCSLQGITNIDGFHHLISGGIMSKDIGQVTGRSERSDIRRRPNGDMDGSCPK